MRARGFALVFSALVPAACAAAGPGPKMATPRSPAEAGATVRSTPSGGGPAGTEPPSSVASSPPYQAEDEAGPDDGAEGEETPPPSSVAPPRPHPLDGMSKADIARMLRDDPAGLGSISLGRPGSGALVNGVQMPKSEAWVLLDPGNTWGTSESVEFIQTAIQSVRAKYPDCPPVYIGHISSKSGGALRPHVSHQAGRDVDLSYFTSDGSASHYGHVDARNLDRARSWAFVRAFVTQTDVELILIDHSIQKLLREYALENGEDPAWISSLFEGVPGTLRPLILHAKGHDTHFHVRFYNPIAQETARRAWEPLAQSGYAKVATSFVVHRAKKGETLGMLARKYGTTVHEIQLANGLRNTRIREKQSYRIPKRGKVSAPIPVVIPPRRTPPT